jgi:hypothetical protein
MGLKSLFAEVGSVLGLCKHPRVAELEAELEELKNELGNVAKDLDTPAPVHYVHSTEIRSPEEALGAIFQALGIDPTKIQPARIVDPSDESLPQIVRAIANIVPVQDTGQNGEKLFSIPKDARAMLCYDNPENYTRGILYGTTNVGYVTTDGTFTPDFRNGNPAIIVFNEGHTTENPSYTVYSSQYAYKSLYREHGTFLNGVYQETHGLSGVFPHLENKQLQ